MATVMERSLMSICGCEYGWRDVEGRRYILPLSMQVRRQHRVRSAIAALLLLCGHHRDALLRVGLPL